MPPSDIQQAQWSKTQSGVYTDMRLTCNADGTYSMRDLGGQIEQTFATEAKILDAFKAMLKGHQTS